jgi:hypothetical protein
MRTAAVLAVVLSAACAARGPSRSELSSFDASDPALRAGCSFCLQEARDIDERLASAPRHSARAVNGAFEAALLPAPREGELGLGAPAFP